MDRCRARCAPLLLTLVLLAVSGLAHPARAAWFPAEPIDGPSPDIVALGGIEIARDGMGGLVYVKNEGGTPHVFLTRIYLGAWRAPERVDVGIVEGGTQPTIAVGDNGRMVIAWVSQGRLYAALADGGAAAPLGPPQLLAGDGARDPHVDLGINGTAYVVYGTIGDDVRAVRLQGTSWERVGSPLDIVPERAAGHPRVGVSAEGNAVAVWEEDGHVFGRRVTGLTLSVAPQEVSVPEFGGAPGGTADSPDLDIEDDGSYAWVSFRQDIGGASRALARRLVGSTFDPAVAVDAGPGSSAGRVAMNGKGIGLAVSAGPDNGIVGSFLENDVFGPVARWAASAGPPQPVVGAGDNDDLGVAWLGGAQVYGRHRLHDTPDFEPEALLSGDGFGPAAPDGRLEMATSRLGDLAVAFLQGAPAERRLVVASYDRPPGLPFGLSNSKPRKDRQPRLKWRPGVDLWGTQTFKVMVDETELTTTDRSFARPPQPLADGAHLWQVIATDRRGQVTEMTPRILQIDTTPPTLRVRVTGKRTVGAALTIRLRARDVSGLKSRWIEFGDGTKAAVGATTIKRYARAGKFTMKVYARDQARNVVRKLVRLRIRR